jgi:hypothetical protein
MTMSDPPVRRVVGDTRRDAASAPAGRHTNANQSRFSTISFARGDWPGRLDGTRFESAHRHHETGPHHLHTLVDEVMGFLISSDWVIGEAQDLNVRVSEAQVRRSSTAFAMNSSRSHANSGPSRGARDRPSPISYSGSG